ncbi:hypothetical protein ACTWP5_27555 [Streptomyces sp. 4N509B]|uniref:hypothetical protein n=1 Tax=Streptomyces sp. 4N509B TaxID=3457413 RepID=UPI003FD3B984
MIPWRGGCPQREAALAWAARRWRSVGHEPVIGEAPPGPWCKAAAVAAGLPRGDAEVLIVTDADVWCDGIDAAVDAVHTGASWAIPHRDVRRLTEDATAAVLHGGELGGSLDQPAYRGVEGGGITVLRRDLYDVAPLDPRYRGWGQEDEAWALALRTLAGAPWRGAAPLWHLWHPPQRRDSRRWGSIASRTLYRRYQRAARSPGAMRALLADITEVTCDVA